MEDGHDQHMRRVGREPIPTRAEQLHLGRSIREWQDWPGGPEAAPERVQRRGRRAMSRLVSGNLRLVANAARNYLRKGAELDDLMQAGAEGLMNAARKFDPTSGYAFTTYAMWWIRQGFQRGALHRTSTIRLPDKVAQQGYQAYAVAGNLQAKLGRTPTAAEIAACMGAKTRPEEVRQALRSIEEARVTSLSVPAGDAADSRQERQDLVRDPSVDLMESAIQRDLVESVRRALCYLQPEESELIRRVVYGEETLASIAREQGVTREAVRQRWARIVGKMKAYLGADDFNSRSDVHFTKGRTHHESDSPRRTAPPAGAG